MSQPSQSSDEDELSPLEYARLHGIARDHLTEPVGYLELIKMQELANGSICDDSDLPRFDFGPEIKVEERLTCSKEAALLISSIARETPPEEIKAITAPFFNPPRRNKTKLELPLLKTDHESDCKNFASREGFEIGLHNVKLPLEAVNEENYEGLSFPSHFWDIGPKVMEEIKVEKLGVTREAMTFLAECIRMEWTEEDEKDMWNTTETYKRNPAFEPVTPPLSPLPERPQPFEPHPSDPAFQVPIFSDPPLPFQQELADIEEQIFEQDIPTPLRQGIGTQHRSSESDVYNDDSVTPGKIYQPLASQDGSSPSYEVERVKRENLKVEEPLTPENTITLLKSVRFSDVIQHLEAIPPSSSCSPAMDSKFFNEAFGPAAEIVNQQAEQEQLSRADTVARVKLPLMKTYQPIPPWSEFEQVKNQKEVVAMQKSLIFENVDSKLPKSWPGSRSKDSSLPWAPFSSGFARLAVEEEFHDDDSTWQAFVNAPGDDDIIDSSAMTWKAPGLRILRVDDDDEDDLEPGQFRKVTPNAPMDLSSLAKKKKLELQERLNPGTSSPLLQGAVQKAVRSSTVNASKPRIPSRAAQRTLPPGEGDFGLLDGIFSAENSVSNYLELRGTKRAKLADSTYFTTKTAEEPVKQGRRTSTPHEALQFTIRKSPVSKRETLPVPTVETFSQSRNIIVSSSLFKNRALIKQIEAQLPALKLIERDFSAHNTSAWMPGSVSRSPVKSNLDSEADLIVSPAVGILLTTLQKIRQKPLPGTKTKSPIRDRLEKVSTRYEKLVVLASEGSTDECTNGLNASNCLAFGEFIGFASAFDTSISIQFVAGGDETLSKWLASIIAQHVFDFELLPDETFWELFLRRAGLNAFAAQAIIGELKAPEGVDPESPSKAGMFGLTGFVEMGREGRIERFGGLCGVKVLERVSAVIDGPWGM